MFLPEAGKIQRLGGLMAGKGNKYSIPINCLTDFDHYLKQSNGDLK